MVMLTGDNKAISQDVVNRLDINDRIVYTKEDLDRIGPDHVTKDILLKTGAFAEILPDHKFQLVKAAKKEFVVAVTGDGVNDLPALKESNVGIAVKNAVDALKSTADIVLLSQGISVIKDAIIESRKIFARMYSYSVYRISESFRLIITTLILGILAKSSPLTPLQLILIALLNDVPIISLAFDKVKIPNRPSKINAKERFIISTMFGTVGIANSIIMYIVVVYFAHLSWDVVRTMYFLKLTVSGHMLIYVARTKERWWKFLPSHEVILATTITQAFATLFAITGLFMPTGINPGLAVFVWVWALFWMQITEVVKKLLQVVMHT